MCNGLPIIIMTLDLSIWWQACTSSPSPWVPWRHCMRDKWEQLDASGNVSLANHFVRLFFSLEYQITRYRVTWYSPRLHEIHSIWLLQNYIKQLLFFWLSGGFLTFTYRSRSTGCYSPAESQQKTLLLWNLKAVILSVAVAAIYFHSQWYLPNVLL